MDASDILKIYIAYFIDFVAIWCHKYDFDMQNNILKLRWCMNNLVFNCLGVGQDKVFPQSSSLIKFISHILYASLPWETKSRLDLRWL